MQNQTLESSVKNMLVELGEDPSREGLVDTPERVAKAFRFLTKGYHENLKDVIGRGIFNETTDDMVIVRDIEFYSLCEHHMLPFFGKCHIGYIPNGKIIGVSKMARIVEHFARRLQLQERLTSQVAHAIIDSIAPEGVGIVMEAQHLCMLMRGVEKQNSVMTTSVMLGSFRNEPETRQEFLNLIKR